MTREDGLVQRDHLRAARVQVRRAPRALMPCEVLQCDGDTVGRQGGRCCAGQGLERADHLVPWPGPVASCRTRCAVVLRRIARLAASRMPTRHADSACVVLVAQVHKQDEGGGRQQEVGGHPLPSSCTARSGGSRGRRQTDGGGRSGRGGRRRAGLGLRRAGPSPL